jgi:hypothetical protein
MTLTEIVREVEALSPDEQVELMDLLQDKVQHEKPKRDLSPLAFRGVGARLRDMDAQEHVNQLRAEWDNRP